MFDAHRKSGLCLDPIDLDMRVGTRGIWHMALTPRMAARIRLPRSRGLSAPDLGVSEGPAENRDHPLPVRDDGTRTCGHAQVAFWTGAGWVHPLDMGACDRPYGDRMSERDRMGPVFTADYQGTCSGCDEPVIPGEDIRADGQGGYVHADDQCERVVTGTPHRDRPAAIPCSRCFQFPAANGTCGCDDA